MEYYLLWTRGAKAVQKKPALFFLLSHLRKGRSNHRRARLVNRMTARHDRSRKPAIAVLLLHMGVRIGLVAERTQAGSMERCRCKVRRENGESWVSRETIHVLHGDGRDSLVESSPKMLWKADWLTEVVWLYFCHINTPKQSK